jgi:cytidylate kinase
MKGGAMLSKTRSIDQIIEEQVKKWQLLKAEKKELQPAISVVTVSREPGSGGKLIAKGVAECLGYDLFHQELIHGMANRAKVSTRLLETLDEKGLNILEDWVAALVNERHLWPDEYSQHLMKVIGTIGKHGRGVIIGRGANFVLPREQSFRLRVIAPQAFRVEKVASQYGLSLDEAHRRVVRTESDRKAFIHKYFNADIADPLNYDMTINTATVSVEKAVGTVCGVLGK